MTNTTKTPTLPAGKKVKLGDGREGTVVRKEERAGFQGYIVRITSSPDKSQIGQTVGATVPGLKAAQTKKPVQTVVQPIQGVEPKDPQLEKDKERSLKQEETRLLSQQQQNINDRIKMLQAVARSIRGQAITPTAKPQQDQFENLDRLEEAEQEEFQQEQGMNLQEQMMQQQQQQQQTFNIQQQQQQMSKQSWVHPEHADVEVKVGQKSVLCDVAATPKQQASGLQAYDKLPEDRGLWFPQYSRRTASFHMGDVKFPIDIVFVDGDRINKIIANIVPRQSGSWSSTCTDVIEVNGGWCQAHQVFVGDIARTPLTNKRSRIDVERIINKKSPDYLRQAAQSIDVTQVARLIAKAGGWVCGGAVRDIAVGDKPNDIDVFIPKTEANTWYEALRIAGFKQTRRRFTSDVAVIDVIPIDKKGAIEVVEDFDIDVCQWYLDKEGTPTPLNSIVFTATQEKIATSVSNDKFGTTSRRLTKLVKRGWKVIAADLWTDMTSPQHFNYKIHKKEFNLKDKLEVTTPQGKYTMDTGDHKVTVENRYGDTDIWVDDEFPLIEPQKITVDEAKQQADNWLKTNVPSLAVQISKDEECSNCRRMKDVGQSCWWCGAGGSAKKTVYRGPAVVKSTASAHNSYDPVRAITEAEAPDPLEQEVLGLFPHLKKAQELYKPSTDRKPTIDKRNPQERFKGNDTPDISTMEGQDNPALTFGDDIAPDSVVKNFKMQLGYDPTVFREEDHPYALRPSAQRVQINSPTPDTELAGVIPEKLAQASTKLYSQYRPSWNDMEDDTRGYEKMAVIDDALISRWVDSLGFEAKAEAKLRATMFTDAYKNLLGNTLVAAGEASNFELFDSDLLLYR